VPTRHAALLNDAFRFRNGAGPNRCINDFPVLFAQAVVDVSAVKHKYSPFPEESGMFLVKLH
jgi:hypothetical protein